MANEPKITDAPDDADDVSVLILPEIWQPQIGQYLMKAMEDWPEKWDLEQIQNENVELHGRIVALMEKLISLAAVPEDFLTTLMKQISGLFDQAYWGRRNFSLDEMNLDENGEVRALLIKPSLFSKLHQPMRLLGEFWLPIDPDSFVSPDGRMVIRIDEFEALRTATSEQVLDLKASKLQ